MKHKHLFWNDRKNGNEVWAGWEGAERPPADLESVGAASLFRYDCEANGTAYHSIAASVQRDENGAWSEVPIYLPKLLEPGGRFHITIHGGKPGEVMACLAETVTWTEFHVSTGERSVTAYGVRG